MKKQAPIRIKASNAGKLRRTAGVKKNQKIPVAKLRTMAHSSNKTTAKRAQFALNARKWSHPKKK